MAMQRAAIGLRAKTGRAIAVVLAEQKDEPLFLWRGEVSLLAPGMDPEHGPYHVVMDLPWSDAQVEVRPLVDAIEQVATAKVRELMDEWRGKAKIAALGVVGSPQRTLERIGSSHIRAHAAEGILFRRVLEVAAKRNRLSGMGFSERELKEQAADDVSAAIKAMGRIAGSPWRADERLAATAAWLALARR